MRTFFTFKTALLLMLAWNTNSQTLRFLPGPNAAVVKTSSGPIQGTEVNFNGRTVKQYLGIPYAKPPVGELRFKRPQPVEPWSETYMADTMPPACVQYSEYPYPWYDFQDGKSEDCLYLNIWVPKSFVTQIGHVKKSVMFWIYGGGLVLGSNRNPLYEGRALAAEGDIIVVTINYRMSALGFLNSGTGSAPGNQGMYDMLEALKWVNKNIDAFGGDPEKVTLAGQSAGSAAVGLFCISPLAKGLFRSVIMESGSPANPFAQNITVNIENFQKLAQEVGCAGGNNTINDNPDEVVDCLREVDAFTIAKTVNQPTATYSFFPFYGGELFPQDPQKSLINGDFHNVTVLIGNNRDDASYLITVTNPEVFGFFGEKNPRINKSYAETLLRGYLDGLPELDALIEYYLGDVDDDDYDKIRDRLYIALGDFVIFCPGVYFAESFSKAGNKVYFFLFGHRPSTTPWAEWMGVVHFEEVQFIFGLPLKEPRNYTRAEISLSRKMINIWSNFVKYGNTGRLDWPLYSRENPEYVELDTGFFPKHGQGPHKENCDFIRSQFGMYKD